MSKTGARQALFSYVSIGLGVVVLLAYLRIYLQYKNGNSIGGPPIVLILLSVPFLVSGIYGLKTKNKFKDQPIIIRTLVIIGALIFLLTVLFLIFAAVSISLTD